MIVVVLETVLGWMLRRKVDLKTVAIVEIVAIAYVARGNMLANCLDTMDYMTQTTVCAATASDVPDAASLTFQGFA